MNNSILIYKIILSLHIIGFVAWFAGLFYWIRLMVYQSETLAKDLSTKEKNLLYNQLQLMSERINRIIATPAMIWTWIMGSVLMFITQAYLFPWFHLKILLVILLTLYHFKGINLMKQFKAKNQSLPSSIKLRAYNEFATLLLVGIVFSVIIKDFKIIAIAYLGFLVLLVLGFLFSYIKNKKKTHL